MKLNSEEVWRLQELEAEAKESFIQDSDFIPSDYLDEEEAEEWQKLFDKQFS